MKLLQLKSELNGHQRHLLNPEIWANRKKWVSCDVTKQDQLYKGRRTVTSQQPFHHLQWRTGA